MHIENQAETKEFNECLSLCEMIYFSVPGLLSVLCVFVYPHIRFYNYSVNHNKCRKSDTDS